MSKAAEGDRALAGIGVVVVLAFTALNMATPLVPLMLLDLKATPGLLGTVVGVGSIGSLFLAVPGGKLVNVWGYRPVMARSAILCTASVLGIAFFPSIAGLVAGLFFLEIGRQLFVLAVQSQTSDLGADRDLNLDFGWLNTFFSIGQLLGPIIGGAIADNAGYFPAWILIASLIAAAALVLPRALPLQPPPAAKAAAASGPAPSRDWRYFLGAATIIANLASFAVIFVDTARGTFFPVFMREAGFNATTIGFFMSLRALVSMTTRLYMKRFVALCGGRLPALVTSIGIMAAGIALTPFCANAPLLTANAVLVGLGIGIALPLSLATVSEGVRPEDRGTAMGIRMLGKNLALVTNPFFFGFVAQRFSLSAAFFSGSLLLALCAIPIHLWSKNRSRVRATVGAAE